MDKLFIPKKKSQIFPFCHSPRTLYLSLKYRAEITQGPQMVTTEIAAVPTEEAEEEEEEGHCSNKHQVEYQTRSQKKKGCRGPERTEP